jgi:branched-chain amino acid transport system substrate-binding protein
MKKRWMRIAAVLMPVALLTAACGSSAGDSSSGSSGEVKIGVLENTAGALAATAGQSKAGLEYAAKDVSKRYLDGRKIKLVYIEDDGTAQGAVTAATKMIQQNGVKILTGSNTTDQGLALGPVVSRLGGLWIDFTAQGNELTGKSCQPGYFRVTGNAGSYARLAAKSAGGTSVKKWAFLGSDYGFGRDLDAGVRQAFDEQGLEVTKSIFAPLGSADFGSYISQLRSDPAEGLVVGLAGSDAATFIKQATQFKLFDKYKSIIGDGFLANLTPQDVPVYAAKIPQAIEIAGNLNQYMDNPEAKAYIDGYVAANPGKTAADAALPSTVTAYQALAIVAQAVAKAGATDPKSVSKALSGGKFEIPSGKVELRAADHQLLANGVISKPSQVDGKWVLKFQEVVKGADIEPPVSGCKLD